MGCIEESTELETHSGTVRRVVEPILARKYGLFCDRPVLSAVFRRRNLNSTRLGKHMSPTWHVRLTTDTDDSRRLRLNVTSLLILPTPCSGNAVCCDSPGKLRFCHHLMSPGLPSPHSTLSQHLQMSTVSTRRAGCYLCAWRRLRRPRGHTFDPQNMPEQDRVGPITRSDVDGLYSSSKPIDTYDVLLCQVN